MATVTINIVKAGSKVCVVDSATLDSKTNDTATWINKTGADVIVFFPHDDVLSKGHFEHRIGTGGRFTHAEPARKKGKSGPESYRYSVYCEATGRFAVGGSDPEIIVM